MRYARRTKTELTVTEIIAIYYIRDRRGVKFRRGYKPGCLPQNTTLSDRKLRSIQFKQHKTNPITEAKRFKQFIDARQKPPYEYISLMFGLSKARISQMLSLLKNIPSDITDFIEQQTNPEFLCFCTERKLRKLTRLTTDSEKHDSFREMIDRFNEKNNVSLSF